VAHYQFAVGFFDASLYAFGRLNCQHHGPLAVLRLHWRDDRMVAIVMIEKPPFMQPLEKKSNYDRKRPRHNCRLLRANEVGPALFLACCDHHR